MEKPTANSYPRAAISLACWCCSHAQLIMWLYMFGFRLHNNYCVLSASMYAFSRGISTFGAIFWKWVLDIIIVISLEFTARKTSSIESMLFRMIEDQMGYVSPVTTSLWDWSIGIVRCWISGRSVHSVSVCPISSVCPLEFSLATTRHRKSAAENCKY